MEPDTSKVFFLKNVRTPDFEFHKIEATFNIRKWGPYVKTGQAYIYKPKQ